MLQLTFVFIWAVVFTGVQSKAQHPECGLLELPKGAEKGVLTSHKGFGKCPYPPGMECQWVIEGIENDVNSRLRFQFEVYEMPKDKNPCTATAVKFFESDSTNGAIKELCEGRVIPANISSSTNKVVVKFSTNNDFGSKGFRVLIRRATCSIGQFMCSSDASCVNGVLRCNKDIDCPDGSDEENCAYKHGGPFCALNYIQCRGITSKIVCLPAADACNSKIDCPSGDESDEVNCASLTTCPKGWHRCTDSRYAPTVADCGKTIK